MVGEFLISVQEAVHLQCQSILWLTYSVKMQESKFVVYFRLLMHVMQDFKQLVS